MINEFIGNIISIKDETHDVKSFRISKPEEFHFIPGQYCLLAFPDREEFSGIKKPFTFSNSPTDREYIELTITSMGRFTGELFSLNPGDRLEITGPFGEELNFHELIQSDIVFLAGGSGITPFMSIIRYIITRDLPNHIILFYGNKSVDDTIYYRELEDMNRTRDEIQTIHTLLEPEEHWRGERGLIREEMITRYVRDPVHYLWYICGPPAMNSAMQKILSELNIPEESIRVDPWEIQGRSG